MGVVTQADREAAADTALLYTGWVLNGYIEEIRAGKHDDHPVVQAFARHRLASQVDQGWIVSNGAGDKWRTWDVLGPVWTGHRDQATRYARRIDAENVHREDEDAWRIEPYAATHPQPSQKGEGDE